MNFDPMSLIRNFIHVGAGTPMLLWFGSMFGVTPPMVNGLVGAVSTIFTIGASIWSQIHAARKKAA